MKIPDHLLYTSEHEWVEIKGNNGIVGITDYAQRELGDVVFVETPMVGGAVAQMQECGAVESVKTVSSLFGPLSGKVMEVNSELASHPELVNQDPYGKGWILKIELSRPEEKKSLLDAAGYSQLLQKKVH